jgi:protein gp37
MKQLDLIDPPAIVREVVDLAAVTRAIKAAHKAVRQAGKDQCERARAAGERLDKVWDHLKQEKKLTRWLKEIGISFRTAGRYRIIYQNWRKLGTVTHLGLVGSLEFLRTGKTGEEDEAEVEAEDEASMPRFITLDLWNSMKAAARKEALHPIDSDDRFNSQGESDNIRWALWSWNPVTGCLHNCPYCYARDIADRFYEQKFVPALWPARLAAPRNMPFPAEKAAQWMGHKNVFVCSMGDLFGGWVPKEWIDAVLDEVRQASRWNFLFLTKFPIRMAEFDFPDNAWVGTSVDCQARVANAEKAFRKIKAGIKWLSLEPLLEPLKFQDLAAFQWIVMGGASKSSETPEWFPPEEWVLNLRREAVRANVPYFLKQNLRRSRIENYPGDRPFQEPTEAPKALRYLPEMSE